MLPPAQRPPLDIRETTLAVRISSVLGVAVNEDHPSLLDLAKIMSQTEVWHLLCHLCHFKPKKWQVPWLVTTKCSHWWVAYFFSFREWLLLHWYLYTDVHIKKKKTKLLRIGLQGGSASHLAMPFLRRKRDPQCSMKCFGLWLLPSSAGQNYWWKF